MAAEADIYQVPDDYAGMSDARESMYWVGTHHATENKQGVYEREYPDDCKGYKTQRGELVVIYTHGQEEVGGNTAGHHLQFYVEFKKKVKLSTLKNVFSKRIHWEIRKGTSEQADDYCGKDDTRVVGGITWQKGERSKVTKGSRTDLDSVREMVLSGSKRKAIAMEHMGTFVRYHRGIDAWANAIGISLDEPQKKWSERTCHIFYGPSGTGKSLAAEQQIGDDTVYFPEQNAQGMLSFENYCGQQWILLDDFEPKTLSMGVLKRMMDNRPCTLPGRGVARQAQHKGVIITTNHYPETWTEGAMQQTEWEALSRRCKTVWNCGKTHWTILGGTQFQVGEKVESPLPQLLEWAKTRDGAGQAANPADVETEDELDLLE